MSQTPEQDLCKRYEEMLIAADESRYEDLLADIEEAHYMDGIISYQQFSYLMRVYQQLTGDASLLTKD